jgi:bacterial/archaeal transporter family-2 protein
VDVEKRCSVPQPDSAPDARRRRVNKSSRKMLKSAIPTILAASAGISLVVQQALNARLRAALNSAAWSGLVSYVLGAVCMVVLVLVMQDPVPSLAAAGRLSWFAWSGGLFGAIFIALSIFLIPQLGAATFFALLIAGQMLGSIAFDHFGLLGLPVHPVSLVRVIGAALLVAGVILIRM